MTDNVRTIDFVKPASNEQVVQMLEDWLLRARDGQVQAIALVGVRPGGTVATEWRGAVAGWTHELNSGISILQYRFNRMNVAPD